MIMRFAGLIASCVWGATAAAQAVRLPSPTVTYVANESGRVTGVIINRDGDELLVKDETTGQVSRVTITSSTDISSPSGFLDLERKAQPPTALIRGLLIAVRGTGGTRGDLVAQRISFRTSALRVATQINGGEVVLRARERETAARVAATRDSVGEIARRTRDSLDAMNARISNIDAYTLRVRGTVYFFAGSAALTEEAMEILDDLVEKSRGLDAFVIEIAGYTDGSGSAAANQALSTRRAQSVVDYLTTAHLIAPRRIATPAGLGAARPAATNATANGRALNRRVEVRVLVSRGLRSPDG